MWWRRWTGCGPTATWRAALPPPDPDLGEVILELTRNGPYLKCSAVHVATGREVSALGPANQSEALKRVAVAKLKRALGQG
ncbi:DUF6898 family protein [Brevundimonas sp.]|uniref:DUF6898 family protein n=1 Tax=Brevundimonas sp. TaxID=1871086 RepID=UPI003A5C270B